MKVKLRVDVFCDEGDDFIRLEKEVTLPFALYPGLLYETYGKIKSVRWHKARFICAFASRRFEHEKDFRETIQAFFEIGWDSEHRLRSGRELTL